MLATTALLALLALAAPALPYPAPRAIQATERTKCDTGELEAVDAARGVFKMRTPAGLVTYRAGPELQVVGRDGAALGGIAALAPRQRARVYYVVDDGARAAEVDLE